MNKPQ